MPAGPTGGTQGRRGRDKDADGIKREAEYRKSDYGGSMKKTVLITGGAGGIGAACARRLAGEYNLIIACNKSRERALELQRELSQLCDCTVACGDITDSAFVRSLFALRADAVINNAGVSSFALAQEISDGEWHRVTDTNLTGCFYVCREALKKMQPRGEGAIVNISSMWGQTGAAGESAYSASKAGVIGLTKALAKEAGPSGIRVNCICPGVIDTPMNAGLSPETLESLRLETPLGRIGRPEDIAAAAAFLISEDASFITGQILGVNGGLVI